MKTQSEKILDEAEHWVYRLDLIPENDEDREALKKLESQTMDLVDQMIESIIIQKAKALQETVKPDWNFQVEKKKGHSSYYIHLKISQEPNH